MRRTADVIEEDITVAQPSESNANVNVHDTTPAGKEDPVVSSSASSSSYSSFTSFKSLVVGGNVLRGLKASGFEVPSPVQRRAIPIARMGVDVVVQAKSGTGKTCVFAVVLLEQVEEKLKSIPSSCPTQSLVLAPTREIALQIASVIASIGQFVSGLHCTAFIGGTPLSLDIANAKWCHIAVATPGRMLFLLENEYINVKSATAFVLDEADKLLDDTFSDVVIKIFKHLPLRKQVMAFSATYPPKILSHIHSLAANPHKILLSLETPSLQGIRQYYCELETANLTTYQIFEAKVTHLLSLLNHVQFHQCIVFCNAKTWAQALGEWLDREGWCCGYIGSGGAISESGGNSKQQAQESRNRCMESMRNFKLRVIIATDLLARGVDVWRVNLVVCLDMPHDLETYLHRVGRAGRFGSYGISISLCTHTDLPFVNSLKNTYSVPIEKIASIDSLPQDGCYLDSLECSNRVEERPQASPSANKGEIPQEPSPPRPTADPTPSASALPPRPTTTSTKVELAELRKLVEKIEDKTGSPEPAPRIAAAQGRRGHGTRKCSGSATESRETTTAETTTAAMLEYQREYWQYYTWFLNAYCQSLFSNSLQPTEEPPPGCCTHHHCCCLEHHSLYP
ncbi:DEAD box polypeptide 20 [Pelomyxa schiedti]|nr:DEAD box polypeptide 20 [Pelomyxa schiedti]